MPREPAASLRTNLRRHSPEPENGRAMPRRFEAEKGAPAATVISPVTWRKAFDEALTRTRRKRRTMPVRLLVTAAIFTWTVALFVSLL